MTRAQKSKLFIITANIILPQYMLKKIAVQCRAFLSRFGTRLQIGKRINFKVRRKNRPAFIEDLKFEVK